MPITISYSTAGCAGWVFSESLTVVGGFVHVVTRSTRDDDTHETEITEWRVTPDNDYHIAFATLVRHQRLPLPFKLSMHVWHEHMLARHQPLFRKQPLPYLVQVVASVIGQLGDAVLSTWRKLRHWRIV